jgi:hypothetical protein
MELIPCGGSELIPLLMFLKCSGLYPVSSSIYHPYPYGSGKDVPNQKHFWRRESTLGSSIKSRFPLITGLLLTPAKATKFTGLNRPYAEDSDQLIFAN